VNPVDVVVGKRIRARRMAKKLSQTDLGNAIGVRFQQIQKYETGQNRVSASRLWAIADTLGVDVRHFFEGIDATSGGAATDKTPVDTHSHLSDPKVLRLVEVFEALPAKQQHAVLSFMETLAQTEPM
jgi:transcriptional regulator with XRE-family HTH domain